MTENNTPLYSASGDAVIHRPISTVRADGTTSIRMGFRLCVVDPDISGDDGRTGAEEVARLLNLGEGAKDALEALRICFDAEMERRKKLLPNAPATTYTDERIAKIRDVIAKAERCK